MRPFTALQDRIRAETGAQPHLGAIRDYNRAMVGELAKAVPLEGKQMLDLGASVHGFALEAALDHGVALYEGIDFDVARHWREAEVEFTADGGRAGRLRQMNAEQLAFAGGSFDCLMTISTFEHFLRPGVVLGEMYRVLRPGGVGMVTFEPIWSGPAGHHLHHFGRLSQLAPPWSHLYSSEARMRETLAGQPWPEDAPIDVDGALRWIYHGDDINRLGIRDLVEFFARSAFEIVWMRPVRDAISPEMRAAAAEVAGRVPYTGDELLARGLSFLLRRPYEEPAMVKNLSRAAIVFWLSCVLAGCEKPAEPAAAPVPGVVFGEGFYKEEATPASTMRWVRQNAGLRILAPAAGKYRLTFRVVTAFSPKENVVEVSVNGQKAGAISAHAFDLANPQTTPLEVALKEGDNDVSLRSGFAEIRLAKDDERTVSYGLVEPLEVKSIP